MSSNWVLNASIITQLSPQQLYKSTAGDSATRTLCCSFSLRRPETSLLLCNLAKMSLNSKSTLVHLAMTPNRDPGEAAEQFYFTFEKPVRYWWAQGSSGG